MAHHLSLSSFSLIEYKVAVQSPLVMTSSKSLCLTSLRMIPTVMTMAMIKAISRAAMMKYPTLDWSMFTKALATARQRAMMAQALMRPSRLPRK